MKKIISFLLILIANTLYSQSSISLCVGDTLQNFSVPLHYGSNYNWTMSHNLANITYGNGTEHIQLEVYNVGDFWLYVEETDLNGCNSIDSILIIVHPLPSPNIFAQGNIEFCQGSDVLLISDSNYINYSWNNGVNLSSILVDSSGSYYINVVDNNGCANSSNVIDIAVHPNPIADFSIQNQCFLQETFFHDMSISQIDSIDTWLWDFGDGNFASGSSQSHKFKSIDLYSVKLSVYSEFGCKDSLVKDIEVFPLPNANFQFVPNRVSILDPYIQFNSSKSWEYYSWDFGDSTYSYEIDPLHRFESPGIYDVKLIVYDSNMCKDSIIHQVIVDPDLIIYVANSFTPNTDNLNDFFSPKGYRLEYLEYYEFTIYNRWGQLVFRSLDPNIGWDGTFSGSDFNICQSGKYIWMLNILDELGSEKRFQGNFQLIR
ncbi:MAG: hypothetical protein CMP51_06370 [Flavobacteriales bacterium]|nr:hypothetical protein [Flavobacteriales bacterium]